MKHQFFYALMSMILFCFIASPSNSQTTYNQYNIIQNSSFNLIDYAWQREGIFVQPSEQAAFDEGGMGLDLNPQSFESSLGYIIQTVPFLPDFSSATLTFQYRFYGTAEFQQFGELGIALLDGPNPTTDNAIVIFEQTADSSNLPVLEWEKFRYEFTDADLNNVRAHLDAGGSATFVCYLLAQGVAMHIDEIELAVDAVVPPPDAKGSLAYINQVDSDRRSIKLVEPDGSDQRTLFEPQNLLDEIYDITWRPDGAELAFTSNHEAGYSPFSQDIFAIQPNGEGLRRITNYPSIHNLAEDTPTGTVTGSIRNDTLDVVNISIYIQGAPAMQSFLVGSQDAVDFTIPDVADFGFQVLQTVALAYGANYREVTPKVLDVIPGEGVDIGEIQYLNQRFRLDPFHISWDSTGEKIAFDMGGLAQIIDAFPTEPNMSEDLIGTISATDPELSPLDDRVLFSQGLDLRLYDPATGSNEKLVDQLTNGHTWLPDASGIIYAQAFGSSSNLVELDLQTRQTKQHTFLLNEMTSQPTVSWPSAEYIAFTRGSNDFSIQNIWAMEAGKPGYMWPLTDDDKSYNPQWSQSDLVVDTNIEFWSLY